MVTVVHTHRVIKFGKVTGYSMKNILPLLKNQEDAKNIALVEMAKYYVFVRIVIEKNM